MASTVNRVDAGGPKSSFEEEEEAVSDDDDDDDAEDTAATTAKTYSPSSRSSSETRCGDVHADQSLGGGRERERETDE